MNVNNILKINYYKIYIINAITLLLASLLLLTGVLYHDNNSIVILFSSFIMIFLLKIEIKIAKRIVLIKTFLYLMLMITGFFAISILFLKVFFVICMSISTLSFVLLNLDILSKKYKTYYNNNFSVDR